jgi:hypothetical protein
MFPNVTKDNHTIANQVQIVYSIERVKRVLRLQIVTNGETMSKNTARKNKSMIKLVFTFFLSYFVEISKTVHLKKYRVELLKFFPFHNLMGSV